MTFTKVADGVQIEAVVSGLAPNSEHGLHVHEKGSCDDSDNAAGGHFSRAAHPHGAPGSGSHASNLPMFKADASGNATVSHKSSDFSVGTGPCGVVGRSASR